MRKIIILAVILMASVPTGAKGPKRIFKEFMSADNVTAVSASDIALRSDMADGIFNRFGTIIDELRILQLKEADEKTIERFGECVADVFKGYKSLMHKKGIAMRIKADDKRLRGLLLLTDDGTGMVWIKCNMDLTAFAKIFADINGIDIRLQ